MPASMTLAARENPEWTIVIFFGAFWLVAILICPFYDLSHWSLTVGLAFGASATGALIGFLFGLPRVPSPSASVPADATRPLASGTSLEQIADWLTKIVIGAGLVELQTLIPWYGTLCSNIATEYGTSPASSAFVGAWLAFFVIVGFFAAYNLTRVYLSPVYRDLEDLVRQRVAPLVEERDRTQEQMRDLAAEGLRQLNPKAVFAGLSELPALVAAKAGRDPDDPCKGAFGGSSTSNEYKVAARFFPLDRAYGRAHRYNRRVRGNCRLLPAPDVRGPDRPGPDRGGASRVAHHSLGRVYDWRSHPRRDEPRTRPLPVARRSILRARAVTIPPVQPRSRGSVAHALHTRLLLEHLARTGEQASEEFWPVADREPQE
jgi:hypothetical protein